jgi:hypothetical protein
LALQVEDHRGSSPVEGGVEISPFVGSTRRDPVVAVDDLPSDPPAIHRPNPGIEGPANRVGAAGGFIGVDDPIDLLPPP